MAFQHLSPFDPSRNFVVRLTKRIAGRPYRKGDPLDKASVDERILRMLYDHHQIGYVGEETRRDIQSAHPRRRKRDGADASPKPPAREKGPAQRPITNPNRLSRARARAAGAGGAGEAPQSAPAEAQTPPPADTGPSEAQANPANDAGVERIAALVRDHDKPSLISMAEKIEGFRASMSKTQLATLIVNAGDGAA